MEEVKRTLRGKEVVCHVYHPTVTAHQFRHEMASAMYAAGVGEMEAQRILGHADIATTHKIYTHIRDTQITSAAERLNMYFSCGS